MASEDEIMAAQIGRPLRAASRAVTRCALGLPTVARVPPVLEDGEPFPTRYWLCCPLAHRRIARLEAQGGVAAFQRRIADDPAFGAAVEAAHRSYAAERDAQVPEGTRHRPRGGIAGAEGGVKCLHAHFAHYLATEANPVGAAIASAVLPLACQTPCVRTSEGRAERDPTWREPPR